MTPTTTPSRTQIQFTNQRIRFTNRQSQSTNTKMPGGYLDRALSDYLSLIRIIDMSGTGIAIIIQLFIGMTTFVKIRQGTQCPSGRKLQILFFISFVLALTGAASDLTSNLLVSCCTGAFEFSDTAKFVSFCIGAFCYILFCLTLLCTLVTRLYLAFEGSQLKMSEHTLYLFIIIVILTLVSSVPCGIGWVLYFHGNEDTALRLFIPAFSLCLFLYIASSLLAVRLFVVKLSNVAKMQMGTLQMRSSADLSTPRDFHLNSKQERVMKLAAKYILLFLIGISSTILSLFFIVFVSNECNGMVGALDLCVNLFCLHLQFAFADKRYRKCCAYPDSCCRAAVMKRAQTIMHQEAMEIQMEINRISSVSETAETPQNVQRLSSCSVDM